MTMKKLAILFSFALLFVFAAAPAFASSTITIVNLNAGTGQGFDDPTPALPVGGNTGATLGAQRLNAFTHAAQIWGSKLTSDVEIRILASFEPLACDATSAVLGSAGSTGSFANFTGAAAPKLWYPSALANKLAGHRLVPGSSDIRARFNSEIGKPTCFAGGGWYLGLDGNETTGTTDLVAVLLHEFAHGLGFASFVNKKTGTEFKGYTDVYSRLILDNTTNTSWAGTEPSVRRKSTTSGDIVMTGENVKTFAPGVLGFPPVLQVSAPAAVAGKYPVGTASFGAVIVANVVSGPMQYAVDGAGSHEACTALPAGSLAGKIALVDRGTCGFVVKAKVVQDAGATGMVVADNNATFPAGTGMSGTDPAVTIPSVRVMKADGDKLKSALAGLAGAITTDASAGIRAGMDAAGNVHLYAPPVVAPGSSVSHFDVSAYRNLLMEPFINNDLTHEVDGTFDLTLPLLHDIGW
jgi:hypothetical protein